MTAFRALSIFFKSSFGIIVTTLTSSYFFGASFGYFASTGLVISSALT